MKTVYLRLLVVLAAVMLYFPSLKFQFVLDDYAIIVRHAHVQNGLSGLPQIWSTNFLHGLAEFNDGLYRPMAPTFFAFIMEFFGQSTTAFHFLNVLVYAVIALLVFEVLRRVFNVKEKIAVIGALFFVAIPAHTEVVANVKSLDELLGLAFGLGALILFNNYRITQRISALLYGTLLIMAALFSKESALTFVVVVPLVLLWWNGWNKQLAIKLGGAVSFAGILYFAIRTWVLSQMVNEVDEGTIGSLNNVLLTGDFSERFATALWLQVMYIQKLLIPYNLMYDYSFHQIPLASLLSVQTLVAVIVLAFCAFVFWKYRTVNKLIAIGLVWYFATLGVVANLIVLIGATFAERFLFAPSFGLVLVVMGVVQSASSKKAIVKYAPIVVIVIYGWMAFFRLPAWENNYTLYTTDFDQGKQSARVNYNYGTINQEYYVASSNPTEKAAYFKEAIKGFKGAIRIYPDYWDAYNNYGNLLFAAKQYEEAEVVLTSVTERKPDYPNGWYNLGLVYFNTQQHQKSLNAFEQYNNLNNTNAEAWYLAGFSAGAINKIDLGMRYLKQSEALNPQNTACLMLLGNAHGMKGELQLALNYFSRVLQLEPNNASAQQAFQLTQTRLSNENS